MALDLGELSIRLAVNDDQLQQGLRRAESRVEGFADDVVETAQTAAENVDEALQVDGDQLDRSLDQAEGRFSKWGDRIKVAAAAIGVAVGAMLTEALTEALELDEARVKMEVSLGNPDLARKIGRAAGAVYGRGFTETAGEAYEALGAIAASSLVPSGAPAEMEAMTVRAKVLADVLGIDLVDAVKYANTLLGSGLVKSGTEAFDILLAASRKVAPGLTEDILEAGEEYAQFFRTLGISADAAFAMLAAGSAKGTYGIDKVGDAIKEFTIRATDMSTATKDAYKALGLNAEKTTNDLLAGGDRAQAAFNKIVSGLKGVKDPATQAALALALFGTPLEDLNVADIPQFLDSLDATKNSLGAVAGETDKAAKAFEGSASQQMRAFKNSVHEAFIVEAAKAIPYLRDLAHWGVENKAWVGPIVSGLTALAVIIGVITVATKLWAIAQAALDVVFALSPIGLIILAIVAIVAGLVILYFKVEWFRKAVDATFHFIIDAAKLWWQVFSAFWTTVGEFFIGLVMGWWDLFTWFWGGGMLDWLLDKWNGILDWLGGLKDKVTSKARGMWDGIVAAAKGAVNAVIRAWNALDIGVNVKVPAWVPVYGGQSFGVKDLIPDIPYLDVGGAITATGMAVVHRGEEIVPAAEVQRRREGAATGGVVEHRHRLTIDFSRVLAGLRDEITLQGGDVQTVLGGAA